MGFARDAERLALTIPAPCVCVDVPLCNQHKAVAALLARVEAEAVAEEREACARLAAAAIRSRAEGAARSTSAHPATPERGQ